jgi:hypothetical protein
MGYMKHASECSNAGSKQKEGATDQHEGGAPAAQTTSHPFLKLFTDDPYDSDVSADTLCGEFNIDMSSLKSV